jgi:PDZ domain-containing protein
LRETWMKRLRFYWPLLAGIAGTVILLFFIPVPYIVYEPGPVVSAREMVNAKEAPDAEGEFFVTTVRWTYANVFKYATALLDDEAEIFKREDVLQGAGRSEYAERQALYMRSSHSNALEAVYRALDIPYEVKDAEISVFAVVEGMGADGVLRPGDRLTEIDGVKIREASDVSKALEGRSIEDTVTVRFMREGQERIAEITLQALPNTDPPRPGIGITYGVIQTVESIDPKYRVEIRAGSIGGPSAGLIFALELYDRFTEEDWTKGYNIAGTGEITPDGTVLPIGGVVHKVSGAHREGADLFFVPYQNAEAAEGRAEWLRTDMRIVPVGSLQEALDYLAGLPEKDMRTGGR